MLNLKLFIIIALLVRWGSCQPLYPPSGQSNTRGYLARGNFKIVYANDIIYDFEYVPTVQGYRYGYVLNDGTQRDENIVLKGSPSGEYSKQDGKNTDLNAIGVGGRPRMPLKNRKLSPGSLKSLAG